MENKELIGYACYYCKKYYRRNPWVKEARMCCFDKSEAIGESLSCKDGSEDHTLIDGKETIKIYRR